MALNLRHARHLTGRAALSGYSEPTGDLVAKDLNEVNQAGSEDTRHELNAAASAVHDETPLAENDDPWRRRIIRRWLTPFEKLTRRLKRIRSIFIKPPLTDEEKREAEENKERSALAKFHEAQAILAANQLISVFTRLGKCKKRITEGSEKILDRVWFDVVKYGPMAYYYHVGHYPDGISVMDLYNEEVCTDLSESVGHRVRSEYRADNGQGLIFIVEIASAMGIPEFVSFSEMIEAMPANLPSLSFPAGVASNGRHVRRSLEDMPHLLVAGGTGAGKSNMINAIICSLVLRNTPEKMKMILFDLKRGVEFWQYAGLPHLQELTGVPGLKSSGIIETMDDVLPALKWIIEEGDDRLDIIKRGGFRDITGYNARKRGNNRMGRMVIVIDEWANIKLMLGTKAEGLLTKLTNLYRAAGIHVILATQNPKAEIVNTVITTNFNSRMAFGMPAAASQTVLGNWHAMMLSPKGRFILQTPAEEIQLQAPRITDSNIQAVVKQAIAGTSAKVEMSSLDPEEICEWALDNLGGSLAIHRLLQHYKTRLTYSAMADLLASMENKEYIIDETRYLIIPGAGNNPRRMERVD